MLVIWTFLYSPVTCSLTCLNYSCALLCSAPLSYIIFCLFMFAMAVNVYTTWWCYFIFLHIYLMLLFLAILKISLFVQLYDLIDNGTWKSWNIVDIVTREHVCRDIWKWDTLYSLRSLGTKQLIATAMIAKRFIAVSSTNYRIMLSWLSTTSASSCIGAVLTAFIVLSEKRETKLFFHSFECHRPPTSTTTTQSSRSMDAEWRGACRETAGTDGPHGLG